VKPCVKCQQPIEDGHPWTGPLDAPIHTVCAVGATRAPHWSETPEGVPRKSPLTPVEQNDVGLKLAGILRKHGATNTEAYADLCETVTQMLEDERAKKPPVPPSNLVHDVTSDQITKDGGLRHILCACGTEVLHTISGDRTSITLGLKCGSPICHLMIGVFLAQWRVMHAGDTVAPDETQNPN
jgi:hypothetical protein